SVYSVLAQHFVQIETVNTTQAEELVHARNGLFVLDLSQARRGNVKIVVSLLCRDDEAGFLHFSKPDLQPFTYRFQKLSRCGIHIVNLPKGPWLAISRNFLRMFSRLNSKAASLPRRERFNNHKMLSMKGLLAIWTNGT